MDKSKVTLHEHSAGVVLYRQMKEGREYLLLHYPGGHFDFAKGHIEGEESEQEAAYRELKEETGIENIVWIDGYKEKIEYIYRRFGEMSLKDVVFFLARTEQKKVIISHEHQGSVWLPYKEALQKLTFQSAKDLLSKAEKTITK
jgi:8-oxo-dGTP pyrophosphatase MutT (NUDIX family)